MIEVSDITATDDLDSLVSEINHAAWDEANEISEYDVAALRRYLQRQDTLFVACHEATASGREFMGMASGRFEMKPYGQSVWLYVDEVDVCVDQRQKGAGKAIMQKLIELAEQAGCEEVWLATEVDNEAANALYRSLKPDEVMRVIGYTYATDG